jgi:hypothetical protein
MHSLDAKIDKGEIRGGITPHMVSHFPLFTQIMSPGLSNLHVEFVTCMPPCLSILRVEFATSYLLESCLVLYV